jgi:pyruvate dehydrogenase E2 component (dihydrolipoamide acetyltransferase)
MPINILMPALSPTMEKGNLAKWLKKEGEAVKTGDVIAEIETDKATMEYEAIEDGTLARIVVPEGTQDVPVNQLIAVMAQEGEDVKAAAAGAGKGAPAPKPAEAPKPAAEAPKAAAAAAPPPQPKPSAPSPAPLPAPTPRPAAADGHGANRVFSSPLARRLARDAGIDIGRIVGSGPHGRVIARDVEQAKTGGGLRAPSAAPVAGAPAIAPANAPAMTDQQIRALYEDGSYEVVPHDGMRRTIAQRLTAAAQSMPVFYLTIDCDIGKLLDAREEINAQAPKGKDGKPGYKLSVNDFVIKALALALQKVPDANVSWTETGMLKHKHSDVGVAVAMPNGLITPIVRSAETKSLSAISNEMRDLATRARDRKLKPHEYQGGGTSVSNLGMYGIKDFTAVINPPQSSILAVGTGEERAVVRDGKIVAAHIMSVTLACDHRAIDGALGAVLISAFKALIENPVMMLV